jgi:hypothetical protein
MPIQKGAADPNESALQFTMSYDSNDYQQNVIYTPENDLPTPSPPSSTPLGFQTPAEYYYVYSMQHFLDMCNATLTALYTLIVADGFTGTEAPYFTWDAPTGLITLHATNDFFNKTGTATISMNTVANKYFEAFHTNYQTNSNIGVDYTFVLEDTKNNLDKDSSYLFTQEFVSSATMVSLQSIVITTGLIPIRPEIIPLSETQPSSSSYSNNFLNVITDFTPSFSDAGQVRGNYTYIPSVLRPINFTSDTNLNRIDFKVWWTDSFNNLYPLSLAPGSTATFKFGFIRKDSFYA